MSDYFEKARELGKLMLCSEYSLRLSDADAALKANPAARAKLEEYQSYQAKLQENMKKGAVTDDELALSAERITEMAAGLKNDPVINDFMFAENAYNRFVSQVIGVIRATLTGSTDIEDCTGCGSGVRHCHGCH